MPENGRENSKPSSGIRNVSVGFGGLSEAHPRAIAPAPPYRLLIAGDFALGPGGERRAIAGRDIADLLHDLSPTLEVVVENRLGSFPASVAASVRIDRLAALRPASILAGFAHYRDTVAAVGSGDGLAAFGAAYDKLAALLSPRGGEVRPAKNHAGSEGADENSDDLDGLFDLVEIPDAPAREDRTQARRGLQKLIDETIAPKKARTASVANDGPRGAADALLDEQALALISDARLRQVLENWHALRVLQEAIGQGASIEVTLLQIALDADAQDFRTALSEEAGALHEELFDLVLLANRCAVRGAGVEILKVLADAAETFGISALATLTPDFAGVPAERLACMDAPHHLLEGAGFEGFRSLRDSSAAQRIALFWNDVLAAPESATSPALFMPASWLAAAVTMASFRSCGWPRLRASARAELSGFPVTTVDFQGRETAVATRTLPTAHSAGDLAAAGISVLAGRIDSDGVRLQHMPLLAEAGNDLYSPKLGDQLVFARLTTLMQSVLPEVLRGDETVAEKVAMAERRLAGLAEAISESPRFDVAVGRGDEDAPALDITVRLPPGIASKERFTFQIPV